MAPSKLTVKRTSHFTYPEGYVQHANITYFQHARINAKMFFENGLYHLTWLVLNPDMTW